MTPSRAGRLIATNTVYQALALISRAASGIGISILLGRLAGPAALGEYTAIMSLLLLAEIAAHLGLPLLLTRELSRIADNPSSIRTAVASAIALVVPSSLLWALVLLVAWSVMGGQASAATYLVASSSLVFIVTTQVVASAFRAKQQMHWSAVLAIVQESIFFGTALVVLVVFEASPGWVLAGFTASRAAGLGLAVRLFIRVMGGFTWRPDPPTVRRLARQTVLFAATSLLQAAHGRLDIVLLAALSTPVAVGLYQAATALTTRIDMLFRAVTLSMFPHLAMEHVRPGGSALRAARWPIVLMTAGSTLIAVVMFLFAEAVTRGVFGPGFDEAAVAVRWLGPVIPLRVVANALANVLTASDRHRARTAALMASVGANVMLSVWLVPGRGMMGAVYALLTAELLYLGMAVVALRPRAAYSGGGSSPGPRRSSM